MHRYLSGDPSCKKRTQDDSRLAMTGGNCWGGFTLIEILVVLLLISIVSAAVLFTIGPNQNRQLASFSKDFVEIMNFAEEEAMLKPLILRVVFANNSFVFQRYAPKKNSDKVWIELNDTILGPHVIPDFIQLTIKIKGVEDEDKQQIIISSNGDVTPFTIYIGKRGEKPLYAITGEADGYITSKLLR